MIIPWQMLLPGIVLVKGIFSDSNNIFLSHELEDNKTKKSNFQSFSWFQFYSLNVNEWKFHSPKEWNSCKPLKKEWFCTLNSKFPLVWGVKRRTILFRVVLRLTPQMSGNSLFLEWFSLFMSGNLLFNVQKPLFFEWFTRVSLFWGVKFSLVYI